MATFHTLDGFKIEIVEITPTMDVRFLAQKTLRAMNNVEARAELARRIAICARQ